ncbi:Rap1 Myb domain-containing protein [Neurospora tetraspora]|uniref:Telomeric repeat-binding factor 2-interacting protein 1 n=1 Tax=Neurospora tetraspora TaxID=94610 RepID=A0AAE0JCZ7_9PEZI|nr:Rap1 Myb domain-containing protein [Neurospora tetraspora]
MPSAGIVYEGVLANRTPDGNNNQNPYEGTLFNGLKFWISQRVPDRKSLEESVKANGGKTVLLEKHADILIADHVLKNAPVGSVSWKYITDSISEGQLADIDLYRIEHATAQGARPVGSTMPTKSTRTPYTPQDDNILIHWVVQKERSGAYTRGNKIYMELAEKYPRHTWQSWRDRFSKRYDHQHRDTLVKLLPQDYQPPPPAPPPSHTPAPVCKKENVKVGTPSVKTSTVHTPVPGRSQAQQSSSVPASASGRVAFTEEDDQILIRYLKQMNRQGESLQGNIIYKEFAKQYPHHSWQSWRNRWVETLQATTNLEEDDPAAPATPAAPKPTEPSLPEPTPRVITRPQVKATPQSADQAAAKRRLSAALNRARQDVPTKSSPMGPVKATVTSSAHKKSSPRSTPSRLEEINKRARLVHEEKKKIKSASIIQRAWRSYQARKQIPWRQSLILFQALAQGSLVRWACAPALEESQSEQLYEEAEVYGDDGESVDLGQSLEEGISSEPTRTPREQFYEYFSRYNEALGTNPVPWVTIGGKAVDMWDLRRAVTEQDVPAHARDWQEIAELLDFDWIAEPDVPNQLQAAFQEHLAEFENFYKEYQEAELHELNQGTDEDSEEGEETEEAENDEIVEGEEEVDADGAENTTLPQDPNTTEFRSSPPIIGALKSSGGLKRNLDQIISSPLANMTRKRLRYDVEDEVPESPPKRWQFPLTPIPEVTSRPEETADVAPVDDEEDHDDAADDMPIFGDDGDDYGVEDHRDDNEDVFTTPLQQPRQTTVERALSLRPSSASKSQKVTSAQKKSTTQPSSKNQAQYISSDSDSDSSSDAFATPINPPRPPPERRRSPIPDPIPRPSATAPAARRQLPPRDTAPASRSPPPRFRIPPDPFASDDEGGNHHLARPRQPPSQPRPSSHPHPPRSSAARSSLPAPIHQRHPKQHRQSTAAPEAVPPHAGRDLGNGIASEDPLAIINRYLALGYKKRHCIRGVHATTHDPNVAGRAIDALAKGNGLPNNVPGIWTAIDDEGLKGVDRARERGQDMDEIGRNVREVEGRLLEKHGRKRMELRRKFLRAWDMA